MQVLQRNIRIKEQHAATPAGRPKKGRAAPREVLRHECVMLQRLFTLQEVALVAGTCGLAVRSLASGFAEGGPPAGSPDAQRAVLWLCKQQAPSAQAGG